MAVIKKSRDQTSLLLCLLLARAFFVVRHHEEDKEQESDEKIRRILRYVLRIVSLSMYWSEDGLYKAIQIHSAK
jgi:hypothetical protein